MEQYKELYKLADELADLVIEAKQAVDPEGKKGKKLTFGEWWKIGKESVDVVNAAKDYEKIHAQAMQMQPAHQQELVAHLADRIGMGEKGEMIAQSVIRMLFVSIDELTKIARL